MASEGSDEVATNLNLTIEEKQVYGQLFRQADPESVGIVMGEVAVKFFEKTRLDSRILGEIWQIADRENRGFLTPAGFGVALRLIGHAQAGREPSPNIALQHGPLPRFEGVVTAAGALPSQGPAAGPLSAQGTGAGAQQLAAQGTGPGAATRVPPLSPEKAAQYARVFQDQTRGESVMSGDVARRIFEKSGLGIETLGRIWQLADTEQRGALVQTEFVVAMHLLTSTKSGTLRALPAMLPAGLYEAATRGVAAASPGPGGTIGVAVGSPASPVARQQSPLGGGFGAGGILPPPPTASISRQLTGQLTGHARPAPPNFSNSPLGRAAAPAAAPAATGPEWLITPAEKARMDPVFQSLDKTRKGYITGEEAVPFLTRSGLDEDTLAQIWDLADVNSEGHLTSDTFAVALYLIQQQRQRTDGTSALPAKLPPNLVPPSLRSKVGTASPAPAVAPPPPPPAQPKSAMDDLFGLDTGASSTPSLPAAPAGVSDPFATSSSPVPPSSPTRSPTVNTTTFKPFVPSSSFGRSLTAQVTGDSNSSAPSATAKSAPPLPQQPPGAQSAANDLLGGDDGEASRNLSNDTAELANLSNQIGSLSKHMQDTSAHRSTLQNELSQTSTQKKNFEQRLAQLRTLYEKEARDVRALEEQLKTSRSDTKTLQTQLSTLQASYADLQTQHQTISTALQADQQENASLKERIKAVSAEVNQLKPQIEKLKSEARQQKGIVAINRKQLSLGESERDKLKTEADDVTRQNQDLARQIQNASVVSSAGSAAASPSVASASGKNPFFRRTGSSDIMGVFSSPTQGQSPQQLGEQSFDDVFGPGPAAPAAAAAAAPVVPTAPAAVNAVKPQFTGASTGSSSFSAVTAPTSETATPDINRPGTDATPTAEPASQTSFHPLATTTASPPPTTEAAVAPPSASPKVASPAASATSPVPPADHASAAASPAPVVSKDVPSSTSHGPEAQTSSSSVFGGFGATAAAAAAAAVTAATAGVAAVVSGTGDATSPGDDADKGKSVWSQGHVANDSLSDPFSAKDQQQDKAKEDFESAFASFKAARSAEPSGHDDDAFEVKSPAGAAAPSTAATATKAEDPVNTDTSKAFANFNTEFPPISELQNDESDSDSDGGGFDDDFAPASPKNNQSEKAPESAPALAAVTVPEATHGDRAGPKDASPAAAESAPAASDIFSTPASVTPNVFSAPAPSASMDDIFSAPATSAPEPAPAVASTAAPTAAAAAPATMNASDDDAFDDLDDDFEGLEEAREGSADDDFANVNRSALDDFQSTFESSPTGKFDSQNSFAGDSSFDFSTLGASSTSAGTAAAAAQAVNGAKAATGDAGDWFSFAGDEAKPAAASAQADSGPSAATDEAARPATLNRLDTQNSTNDDPILRQLTGMGYPRAVALSALEKYDYNVDRAANFLANES
ncbi:ef hand domain containing protein [Sporothrix brasiliensis 5110]|uniref:Ef hand domain containing protein n=1 Tax=Sporothrix brasiliensis 5110 TaxID=1398154 RepID=A0A0C2INX4_9PEZI|nr:ef hand domain containing protein [Sporothrix brasiliensis 5110]KIH90741.1 ef hand domain containing protein [Sporothrix brasiliensis 5110]